MSRLFVVLGLLTATLLNLGEPHRYKSPKYRQHFSIKQEAEGSFSREEADGYKECEEYLADPNNEDFYENAANETGTAPNGQHHLLRRHKPKPAEQICNNKECPVFEKLESSGCGYETRLLARANWTSTMVDLDRPEGFREAYIRLYRYSTGANNDRGEKMSFLSPVVERYWLDQNGKVYNARLLVYIPQRFQSNPPASTTEEVWVHEYPDYKLYIRAFGGYREDPEYFNQFALLKSALERDNITPFPYMRLTAGWTHHGFGRQRMEAILVDEAYM